MSDSEDENVMALDAMFTEPPRPPPPEPTVSIYTRSVRSDLHAKRDIEDDKGHQWSTIQIRLVGSHPLWGHYLWNASRAFASYLDGHPDLYRGRSVLELGAGGGLPGIVAAKNGARTVVLTDYPDASLLENLVYNVQKNVPTQTLSQVHVKGYVWGQPVNQLLDLLESPSATDGYDLIIMSDLIFNHSQHDALLRTCEYSLSRQSPLQVSKTSSDEAHSPSATNDSPGGLNGNFPCLLVFYTHHRPHLAHRDMEFFDKARDRGWLCHKVLTQRFPPMFPDDPGEEEVRATVHGWRLIRSHP
ncbi:hypothetical protein AcW1_001532 [Taiwanofungus camphoratus]|nr:hypothetical protein AcV7_003620 [Antrodia cinnamomea]KAI0938831.1 hypothetical protein AcV5_000429 [Antrodia cinnamomea]KAI0945277.1 hypothetical protein AcW1_001532 [Antrodia cinnamomea]